MKKVILLFVILISGYLTFGQISGTKTIPGDYATIEAAIAALNASGVGAGGVTFNVAGNHTETFSSVTAGNLTTSTSSASNPIVFQKSGSGANPLITAPLIGTATAYDGIIRLGGSDYVTFDGIDLQENADNITAAKYTDWGYAILVKSATDASQNITIKNCTVSLSKLSTTAIGIYSYPRTVGGTSTTPTNVTGVVKNCDVDNCTISDVYIGIYWYGSSSSAPTYYGENNRFGFTTGNSITDYGGLGSTPYGIYAVYQKGMVVANNYINGGTGTTTTLYGIAMGTGTSSNIDIYNNTITVNGGSETSSLYGISNATGSTAASNTVNIYNNTVQNCTYSGSTTGDFYAITNSATAATVNIYGNTVTNNTLAGTNTGAYIYGIYNSASMGTNTLNMYNNIVSNNSVTGTGAIYCMYASTATITCYSNQIYNNTVATGSGVLYGYYDGGSPVTEDYHNNTIHDLTHNGTGLVYGMYLNTATGTKTVYGNSIYNLSSAGGTVCGFISGYGDPLNFYRNNIYNLSSTTSAGIVYGVRFYPTTLNMYNNFISDLKAPDANGTSAIIGINISSGTTANVFFNTVYINASSTSTSTFGTSGIFKNSTTTGDFRNNLIVNTSTPGPTGGVTAAHMWSATDASFSYYATTSNNNCFYAGSPGATTVIFTDGTNVKQTIEEYKSFMTGGRETNAITENPPFMNISTPPYNLHLTYGAATSIESGGTTVSTPVDITQDFDSEARYPNTGYPVHPSYNPATNPDIGADEFAGIYTSDPNPPTIQYTPLANTPSTGARTLTTDIQDASGVPTSGIGLPVLYWKKTGDPSYTAVTANYISGNQYDFTFGSGAAAGNTVYYYVAAQDNASPINIGSNPTGGSGYTANPPACSTPPASPNTYYIQSPISGILTIDNTLPTGGSNYNNFTDAINALNLNGVGTGGVTFNVTPDQEFTETPPIITATGTAANPIVFQRAATKAVNPVIKASGGSGTTDAGLTVSGGDYFTFDGIDVSATASTLEYGYLVRNITATDGAKHNTVKNCKIVLDRTNTSSIGIVQSASTTYAGGSIPTSVAGINEYNKYYNVTIENVFNGIVIYNSGEDETLYDIGNEVGTTAGGTTTVGASTADDIGGSGTDVYGIYGWNQTNLKIFNCEVRNLTNTNTGTARTVWGIRVSNHPGTCEFSGNRVHDLKNNYTSGSTSAMIYGMRLWAMGGRAGGTTKVYNNFICGFTHALASASTTVYCVGIELNGNDGTFDMYHNTVRMELTENVSNAAVRLNNSVYEVNSQNNVFSNTSATNSTSKRYCIYRSSGTLTVASNNILYIPSGTNNFAGYHTADYASLELFAAAASTLAPTDGLEGGSCNYDPNFTSATTYTFAGATPAALSGTPIGYITTDIEGNARSTTRPTIGAYETTMAQVDKAPPKINTVTINSSTSPAVSCLITDNSQSVNNATIRLWYRTLGSTGTYTGLDADSKPSGAMNGTYTWNTSLGTLPVGTYEFYIAARDDQGAGSGLWINPIWTTTFIGFSASDPPDFTANPDAAANNRIFKHTEVLAGGSFNVGTGETYTSLTNTGGIFEKLNASTIAGDITVNITSDLTETGTIPLLETVEQTDASYTITIQPNGTTERVISGDVANAMIRFDGADKVTINGQAGRYLRFRNTNTSNPTFTFINDASNNTIQNCIIEGTNLGTSSGVIVFGTSTGLTGNDNNVVTGNLIRDLSSTTGIPAIMIYSTGSVSAENSDNTVSNNEIFNFSSKGVYITGTGNGNGWELSSNSFYNNLATPSTAQQYAIHFIPVSYLTGTNDITGNFIGGQASGCGGSAWQNSGTSSFYGIYINSAVNLYGNTIRNIELTNTSPGAFYGITMYGDFYQEVNSNNILQVGPTSSSTGINNVIGIYYYGASEGTLPCYVYNNVISLGHGITNNNVYKGIDDYAYTGNNLYLLFNSVYIGGTGNGSSDSYGYLKRDAVNEIHRNNIYYNARTGGTGSHYAIGVTNTSGSFNSDNNDLYTPASPVGIYGATAQNDLAAWQTASAGDANSVSVDPIYTSATDLHASAAQLNGTGIAIGGITADHDGVTRMNPPDMGAYEFGYKTWTGSTSSDWNVASNWNPSGVPTTSDDIHIPAVTPAPIISNTGMVCKGAAIYSGTTVTVNNGADLTTYGSLTIDGTQSLVIKSGGSFIDNGTISGTGTAKVERDLVASQHHYISSPISNGTIGIFLDDYLRPSDPTTTDGWGAWFTLPLTLPLEVMRGYDVWRTPAGTMTKLFVGTLNTGTTSITLNRTASDPWAGWHLVGNPYPSAIDLASTGITWNQFEPTAWFWDPSGSGNYVAYPVQAGYGTHTQYAPAEQAFFVHIQDSYSGNTTLTFTNSARVHNTEPFLKSTPADLLVLSATGNKNDYSDKIIINFNNEVTAGYDPGYDAYKLYGKTEAPQLWSVIQNGELTCQSLPWTDKYTTIPLGFRCGFGGTYTFTASELESFQTGTRIYIEDLKEDVTQELTLNPVFTFNYAKDEDPLRFLLHFYKSTIGMDEKESQGLVVYSFEDFVYVKSADNQTLQGVLTVTDLLGRPVFNTTLKGDLTTKVRIPVHEGYYVVRVVTQTGTCTQKVYLY